MLKVSCSARLVLQKAVGGKLAAIVGADAPVRHQEAIKLLDDGGFGRSGRQRHDEVVEGSFHVERAGDRVLTRPQHDEITIVRERQGRACGEHELGRQRDPDNAEGLEPPVENDVD